MNISKTTPYSDMYKEGCFQAWYAAGKPVYANILEDILPEDEHGRKPNLEVVRRWRNEDEWDKKADELDSRVTQKVEDSLVNEKVEMLIKQAEKARKIQEEGMEYLDANGFDSASSALQGIIKGAELERTSVGLSDAILKIAKMTNEQLMAETQKMLQKFIESGESGDIIDVEEIKEDAVYEDSNT